MPENEKHNGHKPAGKRRNPKWTVMVYLAGDNNLTPSCITVLQQLEAVKYSKDVCVLACFDSNTPWPKGSRYLAINCNWRNRPSEFDWEIYNDLIPPHGRGHDIKAPDFCYDKKPEGRPMKRTNVAEGLKRFVDWTMRYHKKSDHYMLILYGHGPVVGGKTFLARENPLSSLRMQDLPIILGRHFGPRRKLDILACQNCVMNGIETAYEVRNQVKYMIGSQGLVLSYGWPYEKVIGALIDSPKASPLELSEKMLKACARHLIDFSIMDRSSEQSVCDLSKLRYRANITDQIRELGGELRAALAFKIVGDQKVLEYPAICDAVKLARLEAQAYWGEAFVDVYDFCERLLKKCNEAILVNNDLISNLGLDSALEPRIRETNLVQKLKKIIQCCRDVMKRVEEMVPYSYYIGAELQYSHGLSIYFPWTMQGEPYSFREKQDYHELITAFQTYCDYSFVKESEWGDFLKSFYRATLRKVRRWDREFSIRKVNEPLSLGMVREEYKTFHDVLTTAYMQKTDSNTGVVDYEVWSNVKNYPRRNYVSPSDCPKTVDKEGSHRPGKGDYPNPLSPPISYLGWNICEFVADVIRRKPPSRNGGNTKKRVRLPQKAIARRP